jgi:multiple sugar transport system ATP-binding protein
VTLRIGDAEMVARCPAAFREPPGTAIAVHVNPSHLQLFDARSGAALH